MVDFLNSNFHHIIGKSFPILKSNIYIFVIRYLCLVYSANMELHDATDQLISQLQELYVMDQLSHEDPELFNSFVQGEEQLYVDEPYALEMVPATYMQGAGVILALQDALGIHLDEFSKTYNVPYDFPPSYFGEPFFHNLESSKFPEDPYPVCLCIIIVFNYYWMLLNRLLVAHYLL